MNPRTVFLLLAVISLIALPATGARAADEAGALMTELSQLVRLHGEKFARCIDNTAVRHAQNSAATPETAAAAGVEDCEGVLRVFVASCSPTIQALCENFAKEMRTRELKRAGELIARLRVERNMEK